MGRNKKSRQVNGGIKDAVLMPVRHRLIHHLQEWIQHLRVTQCTESLTTVDFLQLVSLSLHADLRANEA